MENVNFLNKEMIALGLMREATNKDKKELRRAGNELSPNEEKCYRAICVSGVLPINNEDICRQIYPKQKIIDNADIKNIWVIISRIRQKLGHGEIICKFGFGYVSRRMLINDMVEKNLKKSGAEIIFNENIDTRENNQ